ncbi:MAG: phytoene/squalene synthase family protein [Phycisphaeraceae bacterium]
MSTTSMVDSANALTATSELRASFACCAQVARQHGRNFYYGMKLMAEPRRSAMYAVYAWMRAADDLADEPGAEAQKQRQLDAFRRQTAAAVDPHGDIAADGPSAHAAMWPAVADTFRRYRIDHACLAAMIQGQLLDQHKTRYASFAELHDYCYKVASTVGLVCLSVWGAADDATARQLAVDRGLALQLTNILRDLVEDARRDRLYLPTDELRQFGIEPEALLAQLREGQAEPAFDDLMAFQIERARAYYTSSAALESHLDASCRPTCWAMMRIYHRLLEKIAAAPRRVLTQRIKLSTMEKLTIGLRAMMRKSKPRMNADERG